MSDLRSLLDDAAGASPGSPDVEGWWRTGRRRRAVRRASRTVIPLMVVGVVVASALSLVDGDDRVQVGVTGASTTPAAVEQCGSEMPLKSFSGPYGTPQRDGRAPLPRAPEVENGQLVVHWTDGIDRAIEMRWPSSPRSTREEVIYEFPVAGRPATISHVLTDLRQVVRVRLSGDEDDPCAELSIEGYAPIDAQAIDELLAFAQEDVVDASAPPPSPRPPPPAPPVCEVPPVAPDAEQTVTVYLYCRNRGIVAPLVPVERAVPETRALLGAALTQLTAGTTDAEATAGLESGVPEQVQGAPVRVAIDEDGVASVEIDYDFSTIDGLSTSNASLVFVDPIYATAFQFPTVTAVDLGAFCTFTELECTPYSRARWERQLEG